MRVVIKFCYKCQQYLPLSAFNKQIQKLDGVQTRCRECQKKTQKEIARRTRAKVLRMYGDRCVCCGESKYEFLCLDHKNGDGNVERRKIPNKRGYSFYRYVLEKGYQPNKYQILCHNCNMSIGFYGYCPTKL